MMKQRIGFIGVGLMGHGMAKNLVEKGFPLTVLGHKKRAPVEDLKKRGAKEAKSVKALVEASDVVILCVTGTPQVEDMIYRADGIRAAARKGLTVIDCSTSEPPSTAKIYAEMKKLGVTFVDAPLTRTPIEAEQGRLNTLVGAEAKVLKAIRPILEAFCENIFHIGGPVSGHQIKLINNFFSIGQGVLISEMFSALGKVGIDPRKLVELVSKGAANSGLFQLIAGGAAEGDYARMKFAIANASKDVTYYNRMLDSLGLMGPIAAALQQSLKHAVALGYGDKMVPSLVEAQREINRLK